MACEGYRVRMGRPLYRGQGYEGEVSVVRVAATRRHHLYVMAMLSGARVVHALCMCFVAAPCYWVAYGCVWDASECARWWLTPLGRASTMHFIFRMMPKRQG